MNINEIKQLRNKVITYYIHNSLILSAAALFKFSQPGIIIQQIVAKRPESGGGNMASGTNADGYPALG